jgi:cysteine-rich repeat protein
VPRSRPATLNPFRLCGNGVIDPGEQCDDGDMNSDTGACLTTCRIAFCGDGWVYVGKEDCDTNNFLSLTCKNLGFDGGTLRCTTGCTFDTSQCGPAFTPTPTAAQTSTPTPTPTPSPATTCGDGLIENGETCDACATDCTPRACTASGAQTTFTVNFAPPPGEDASSVTVLVGYRSDHVSIPGAGSASTVTGRVKNKPMNSILGVNDLDYAVRVVLTRSSQIPPGRLFTVDFDSCAGATVASSDVSCSVAGCASSFGAIEGCTCAVAGP